MGLKKFFDDLWNVAEDVASLDVVTLTGRIELKTADNKKVDILTKGELDPTKLRQQIATQLTGSVNMRVLGMTHIAIDKDSVEFIDEDALVGPAAAVHQKNVETAIASRAAIWKMVVEAFKGVL